MKMENNSESVENCSQFFKWYATPKHLLNFSAPFVTMYMLQICPRNPILFSYSVRSFVVNCDCTVWFLDIAFASRILPSSVEATRFLAYCDKWIPELRGHLDFPSFLSFYMKRLEKELDAVNEYRFRLWAGRSLDKSSQPFKNCWWCWFSEL